MADDGPDASARRRMARVRKALLAIPDVEEGLSIFAPPDDEDEVAFFVDGRQVVSFAPGGDLNVRLTRPVISAHRERIRGDERVSRRRPSSEWVEVSLAPPLDLASVVDLVELAVDAHRPPPGVPCRPPPTGADLARRRRFH